MLLTDHREQGNRRYAQCDQFGSLLQQQIQRQAFDPRHAGDGLAAILSLQYEDRIDEIIHGQNIFPDQAAAEVMFAQTARAAGWKGRGNELGHNGTSSRRKKALLVARVWASSWVTGSPRSMAMLAAIWGRKAGSLRRDLGFGLRSRGNR